MWVSAPRAGLVLQHQQADAGQTSVFTAVGTADPDTAHHHIFQDDGDTAFHKGEIGIEIADVRGDGAVPYATGYGDRFALLEAAV